EHARGGEPATGRRDRRYGNDHRARAAHERYSARSSSANDLAATSKVPPAGTSARGCRRSRRRGGSLVSTTSSHALPNRSSGAVNVIGAWWALKRMGKLSSTIRSRASSVVATASPFASLCFSL